MDPAAVQSIEETKKGIQAAWLKTEEGKAHVKLPGKSRKGSSSGGMIGDLLNAFN